MQARYVKRRPHLERKLAFMRSELVAFAVQHDEQREAMEVAVAYGERMAERLAEEKRRVEHQRSSNEERRAALRAELANQGSARRLRQIEAMNERAGPTTEAALTHLKVVVRDESLDQANEMHSAAVSAAKKAEANYEAGTSQIEGKVTEAHQQAHVAKEMTRLKVDPRQSAWEKLCIVADVDHLRGVLEYWEEKVETRQTLDELEETHADRKGDMIRDIGRLEAALHNQRESNTEARKAFDANLDVIGRKGEETEGVANEWRRRCARVDKLTTEATTILTRLANALTHRAITERAGFAHAKELKAKNKSLDEMQQARSSHSHRSIRLPVLIHTQTPYFTLVHTRPSPPFLSSPFHTLPPPFHTLPLTTLLFTCPPSPSHRRWSCFRHRPSQRLRAST